MIETFHYNDDRNSNSYFDSTDSKVTHSDSRPKNETKTYSNRTNTYCYLLQLVVLLFDYNYLQSNSKHYYVSWNDHLLYFIGR